MDKNEENVEEQDAKLIEDYLAGDAGSFDKLYLKYKKPLYKYLNQLLDNSSDADDVFQETWLKALKSLQNYKNQQKFFAWLTVIAHNVAIDFFRKNKANAELPLEETEVADTAADESQEPWHLFDNAALADAIDAAIKKLSPELREVFLLRMRDVSFKEIAEIQKCPLNTALGRMNYAVKNLRKNLKEWVG